MTDLYIALAWIMGNLPERSRQYILHGLGEEKLLMEHYKQLIEEDSNSDDIDQIKKLVEMKKSWINSQRHDFLVEVNLGHWANLDYRKMAVEAGCEGLYKFAYKPFSHVAHNMWPHISLYNCRPCKNPLHRYHLVPELLEFPLDPDYLYRSCKYVDKTYRLFVDKLGLKFETIMPLDWWYEYFEKLPTPREQDEQG